MDKKAIRWGIIGCGNVTEVKSGPGFQKAIHSSLQAVMRRNADAAADYAARHGVPRWYDQPEDLIHDPEVDAVYIATPPSSHSDLALQVAAAGKPCYVEKPMAISVQECEAMIESFTLSDTPLFIAYYRRALPQFVRMRQMINEPSLGPLKKISLLYTSAQLLNADPADNWRFDPNVSGGGLVWDLGSHALDLMDYLAGPLEVLGGYRVRCPSLENIERRVTLEASASSRVRVECFWDFMGSVKQDQLRLHFEHAEVIGSVFGPAELQIHHSNGTMDVESFRVPQHVQQPLIQNIVDSLLHAAEPLSTGMNGLRTNRILESIPWACEAP